jgi:D-tyrosyl-tRNA(Tyr) deacylase
VIAVVQRVTEASVVVDGAVVGRVGGGLLALVAVHATDEPADVEWTAAKLVALRIFRSGDKHFEADVRQAGGSVLLVSNFTVAARTRQGRRPSFDDAAPPPKGRELYDALVAAVRAQGVDVQTGVFGADMTLSLVNDGPVTVIVDSRKPAAGPAPLNP